MNEVLSNMKAEAADMLASGELRLDLAHVLAAMYEAEREADYTTRNMCTFLAVAIAQMLGYRAGMRLDPSRPDLPMACIELPSADGVDLVVWHTSQFKPLFDGHDTDEKWRRVWRFITSTPELEPAADVS